MRGQKRTPSWKEDTSTQKNLNACIHFGKRGFGSGFPYSWAEMYTPRIKYIHGEQFDCWKCPEKVNFAFGKVNWIFWLASRQHGWEEVGNKNENRTGQNRLLRICRKRILVWKHHGLPTFQSIATRTEKIYLLNFRFVLIRALTVTTLLGSSRPK